MGRAPCCEKVGLKRGWWTAEEDEILAIYIAKHGEGSWTSLPKNAGNSVQGGDRPFAAMKVTVEHCASVEVQKEQNESFFGQSRARKWSGEAAAVVRVQAPPADSRRRFRIYLAVVIDVGSSMAWDAAPPAGKPSRSDLLKKAMRFIIKKLHNGDHRLSFVFNDKFTSEKFKISEDEAKVHQLFSNRTDNTSLEPSLKSAIEILNDKTEKDQCLGFILVLSDRLEDSEIKCDEGSVGVADMEKYPVHALGLGMNHDPRMLKFIADESYGTYSCITGDDLHGEFMKGLGAFLGGLTSVVAANIVITVRATAGKTTITKVESGGYQGKTTITKVQSGGSQGKTTSIDEAKIRIGPMYAREEKNFRVHFKLNTPRVVSHATYEPLITGGKYEDDQGNTIDMLCTQQKFSVRKVGQLPSTEKNIPFLPSPTTVMQEIVRAEALSIVVTALDQLHDNMKKVPPELMKKEDARAALVSLSGATLRKLWEKFFEDTMKDAEDKKEPNVQADLRRLDDDIKPMIRDMCKGLLTVMPYVYAWVSRHQMQRATTTGWHPNSSSFLTPEMKAMVDEARTQQDELAAAAAAAAARNTPGMQPSKEQRPASGEGVFIKELDDKRAEAPKARNTPGMQPSKERPASGESVFIKELDKHAEARKDPVRPRNEKDRDGRRGPSSGGVQN